MIFGFLYFCISVFFGFLAISWERKEPPEILRGSHGLSAQRARRTKSSRPKGLPTGSRGLKVKGPQTSMINIMTINQEYERAVIFRLGRLLTGGARGPGVFFIIPCVDVFEKIDMRTMTYEIPPQEVDIDKLEPFNHQFLYRS